jgi:RNA polymerase primary sigma factor
MRAIDKFNPNSGYRLSTYSAWWIRQAITRALIDQGKTIRVPVYMSELMTKYKKTTEKLRQEYHRDPTRQEIAKKMKRSMERVAGIEMWSQKKASFEAPVGDDGESQLGDFITNDEYTDTSAEVERTFEKEQVHHLLDVITQREKEVLNMRFGIEDNKPRTLSSVAKELHISRERVRQVEKEALKKLHKYALEEQKKELA